MALYIVIAEEGKGQEILQTTYPLNYKLTDGCYLVRSHRPTVEMVASSLGIPPVNTETSPEEDAETPPEAGNVVVFGLSESYYGYFRKDLWTWLEQMKG